MKKLMTMTAIGMVACSMMTGCWSGAVSKGGTYAALPDPKPDAYEIHWKHDSKKITAEATVCGGMFGFFGESDKAPWMLRDEESKSFFGLVRDYPLESKVRNAALYKACHENEYRKAYDALVGAMYIVEVEDWGPFFKKATCKVTGWPAEITGIENVANKAK